MSRRDLRATSRASRSMLLMALASATLLGGAPARAQDEQPTDLPHDGPGPVDPSAPVPANHPPMGKAPSGRSGAHGNAAGGAFEPLPDTTEEDEALPAGTIAITLFTPEGLPLPATDITLGIMQQSVAKGEKREHRATTSDGAGHASFDGLKTGAGIAYRVSVAKDAASFAAMPFQLSLTKGMRVGLHVYPVTRDINEALIVTQVVLYAELKDDRVQLEEALSIFNFGRVAWVPREMVLPLPEGFTALNGIQQMSDTGIDPVDKRGARLRGTFGPGRHDVEFRFQLPYAGERQVTIDEGLPPHVAVARVMAPASSGMRLVVDGFPEAVARTDKEGQRMLITERQMRRDDLPLNHLHAELRDLPTAGPGRLVATTLSGLGVAASVAFAFQEARRRRTPGGLKDAESAAGNDARAERRELLESLEDLERARQSGEVGPKTYDRARREILDALARTLASEAATKDQGDASPKPTAKASRTDRA